MSDIGNFPESVGRQILAALLGIAVVGGLLAWGTWSFLDWRMHSTQPPAEQGAVLTETDTPVLLRTEAICFSFNGVTEECIRKDDPIHEKLEAILSGVKCEKVP